ncbi:hypothetical protein AB0L05_09010 [Nonomuraea pusilla]|uniref:hypothetical protein n=1 Tax=Nonomuraea pusilla TaxID=46177 RepID=UPI00332A1359
MSTPAGRLPHATSRSGLARRPGRRVLAALSALPLVLLGVTALAEQGSWRFERGEALRVVHPLHGLLLGLLFVAAVIDGDVVRVAWEPLIGGAILTSVLLPSAVLAWRWQDLGDTDA